MKKYCRNCKHHYFPNIDGSSIYEFCTISLERYDTPMAPCTRVLTCEETGFNKHNNCKHYGRKWYKFWVKR